MRVRYGVSFVSSWHLPLFNALWYCILINLVTRRFHCMAVCLRNVSDGKWFVWMGVTLSQTWTPQHSVWMWLCMCVQVRCWQKDTTKKTHWLFTGLILSTSYSKIYCWYCYVFIASLFCSSILYFRQNWKLLWCENLFSVNWFLMLTILKTDV